MGSGLRVPHKVQVAVRPDTWADLGTAFSLRFHGAYRRRSELSWPISPDQLSGMRIRWPSEYRWPLQKLWLEPLRQALAEFLPVDRLPFKQPSTPVVVFHVLSGSRSYEIGIDYSDYVEIDEPLARSLPVYLKMQHLSQGYGIPSVIPAGYPSSKDLNSFLGGARRLAALPSRQVVYGRFSPNNTLRHRAVDLLQAQDRFAFEGGFSLRRYGRHLAEAAEAAVCIDMPGNGPLCFRLIDYLAVGCCVVTPRQEVSLHVPLRDGIHVSYVKSDLSDLVDVCDGLLGDIARRERQRAGAADFYDRYLESRQLAAYHLHAILDRIR
jgi:hypothetical protein